MQSLLTDCDSPHRALHKVSASLMHTVLLADVPLPPLHPHDESDHVATMLYIVDFLSQFSKVLAMKPISFQDFCQSLNSTAAASAPPSAAATAMPGVASSAEPGAPLNASGLAALAAPSAVVNGAVGHAESEPNAVSSVNGLLATAGATDQADGDSTVLFDAYRGLLQFLLQVCKLCMCACSCLVTRMLLC